MSEYAWIVALGGLILTALGVYAGWVARIMKGEGAAETAAKALAKADEVSKELHSRIDGVAKDLGEFKEHVARDYASNRALEQMEKRVVDAISRLGDRLDRAFDRMVKE